MILRFLCHIYHIVVSRMFRLYLWLVCFDEVWTDVPWKLLSCLRSGPRFILHLSLSWLVQPIESIIQILFNSVNSGHDIHHAFLWNEFSSRCTFCSFNWKGIVFFWLFFILSLLINTLFFLFLRRLFFIFHFSFLLFLSFNSFYGWRCNRRRIGSLFFDWLNSNLGFVRLFLNNILMLFFFLFLVLLFWWMHLFLFLSRCLFSIYLWCILTDL